MTSIRPSTPAWLSVCALILGSGSIAFGAEMELEISLSGGADSNPLELPEDPRDAGFGQAVLGGKLGVGIGYRSELFIEGEATERSHRSGFGAADSRWGEVRAGYALEPGRTRRGRLSLAVGALYGYYGTTFVDPATGEAYAVNGISSTSVPVPDRFDHDRQGGFLELRLQSGSRAILLLDIDAEKREFRKDYSHETSLDSLDDRSLKTTPGIRVKLSRRVLLDLSYSLTRRTYADLAALDRTSARVPGTTRAYRYGTARMAVMVSPVRSLRLTLGLQEMDRSDLHDGYYDYDGAAGFVSMTLAPSATLRFDLHASRRELDYVHATVDSDPAADTRSSRLETLAGAAEKRLSGSLALFIEAGRTRSGNEDPLYAFDRSWVQTGVRMKL